MITKGKRFDIWSPVPGMSQRDLHRPEELQDSTKMLGPCLTPITKESFTLDGESEALCLATCMPEGLSSQARVLNPEDLPKSQNVSKPWLGSSAPLSSTKSWLTP